MKKIKNKKLYGNGGWLNTLPGGDPTTKTVAAGTAYGNNQGAGNSGIPLQDQFSLAKKYLKLPYGQDVYNKLTPDQKLALSNKTYEAMGFTQTGANSFSGLGVSANGFRAGGFLPKYGEGGAIGGFAGKALAAGLNFIPGVSAFSPLYTPLLEGAGTAIGGKIDGGDGDGSDIPVAAPVARTINPNGIYKFGGNLPMYAEGGAIPPGDPGSKFVKPEEVYKYLRNKGVSHIHAMGILSNIQGESNFEIGVDEKAAGGEGVGLFQYTHASRKTPFIAEVPDYRTNWKGQIDFMLKEAPTTPYLKKEFKTPEEASTWFTVNWENPANKDQKAKERVDYLKLFKFDPDADYSEKSVKSAPPKKSDNPREVFIRGADNKVGEKADVLPPEKVTAGNDPTQDFNLGSASAGQSNLIKYQQHINQTTVGIRKYGGQLASNVVATAGGKFEDLGDNILLAKGNLHTEGGIDVDTKSKNGFDGVADANVEDGEPIITDAGETSYVVNRDIAKPYLSMLKQLSNRQDKVSDNTRKFIKQEMMKKNEAMKQSLGMDTMASADSSNGNPKFAYGGGLYPDRNNLQSHYSPGQSMYPTYGATIPNTYVSRNSMDNTLPELYMNQKLPTITPKLNSGDPNTVPFDYYSRSEKVMEDLSATAPDWQQNLPFTPPGLASSMLDAANPEQSSEGRRRSTGNGLESYSSESYANNYHKAATPENEADATGLKTTSGDWMQLAGMGVATAYNLGRGLLGKADHRDPINNPYEDRALAEMRSRTYNPQPIQNQLDRTFAAGRSDINNLTSSSGSRLGNVQNLYSNLGQQRAMADMQGQQMNNQYKGEYASTLNNFGAQRVQATNMANAYNDTAKATKDAYISEGVSNLAQGLTGYGQEKNTMASNALGLKILNSEFPDYYFDTNAVNSIISGRKPSWMTPDEFQKAQILLNRSGFKNKID